MDYVISDDSIAKDLCTAYKAKFQAIENKMTLYERVIKKTVLYKRKTTITRIENRVEVTEVKLCEELLKRTNDGYEPKDGIKHNDILEILLKFVSSNESLKSEVT